MVRRRSFLDSGEVDEVAARAGLIDAAAPRPAEPSRPVRFAYTGSSLVVAPAEGDATWATRSIVTDRDPDAHPRLLRLRATAPPGGAAPAPMAVLEWAASCADARAGALCDADGAVLASFVADDWPVGAWARLATAARAIAEPREGLSLALPVVGGVLRVCFSGLQADAPSLLLLAESDPGDAFGDEVGAVVGRLLGPGVGVPSGPVEAQRRAEPLVPHAPPAPTPEPPPASAAPAPELVPPVPDNVPPVSRRTAEGTHTRPEAVVAAGADAVLVDDLLQLIERAPAPRWSRLRVAVRTRIPPARLVPGGRFTREERAQIRYAVGRVLVMEVP